MVVVAHATVDELEIDVLADSFEIPVMPGFEGESTGVSPSLVHRPLVVAAGRVAFNLIGRAPYDVNATAIRLPTRHARRELLVSLSNASIMLFAELIFRCIGSGIAP